MADKKQRRKPQKMDLAQKAYQGIRQMLFYNEIIPGQKIKYQDLADKIGVSITPVIHALKWLEFKNIVSHEPNRGYFVNEVSLKEIKEIYDTRLLLEVSLVPEIINSVDEASIQRLKQSQDDYFAAVDEENYYSRLMTDMKFHLTLASISQCRIQLKMLQELFDMLLLKYTRNLVLLGIMDSSLNEHADIFDSLKKREVESLNNTLSAHLDHVRTHITEGFKRMFVRKKESMVDLFTFQ
ncbi:GntR family transcriptional regulator [Desulfosarcina sp.]|uniref:GntR family transcriptional regulator n=1 Tax=Desulfosarcina sp. TaxID=2027861 RepID=UPI00356889CF